MEQNRFKSPVVWSTLATQLLSILVVVGVIDTGMSKALEAVVLAILNVLGMVGILNNPTSKNTF